MPCCPGGVSDPVDLTVLENLKRPVIIYKRPVIIYFKRIIVQELCESRGGRPELSVLMSLLVSVDVKNY